MKLSYKPENMVERVGAALGLLPSPMMDTWCAQKIARWVMAATKLGLFEALEKGPASADQIGRQCGTNLDATAKLLGFLTTAGYVSHRSGTFSLTAKTRKWMLKSSPTSLYDSMLFQYMEWKFIEGSEEFLKTGKPIDFHAQMSAPEWETYQKGMRSVAGTNAREVVRAVPVPRGAQRMLDIGGSHGYYSVALCRKYPGLSAIILDLPQAIASAAGILAKEAMGDRVRHQAGNALTTDLDESQYDLVFISSLVHHFDAATNRDLMKRIARSLKPGGSVAVMDYIRLDNPDQGGQVPWIMNFYFALTSQSGAWSLDEIRGWQEEAGLKPSKPVHFRTIPGSGIQSARKT